MIELPEALVLSAQIVEAFAGRRVVSMEAAHSPHGFAWYEGPPERYAGLFKGRTLEGCRAFGGRVALRFTGDLTLDLQDGVNPRYLKPGEPRPEKHQLLIEFDDGAAIVCTIQMYGGMMAYVGESDNFYARVAREKPSPLSDAFDEAYFNGLFEGIKKSLSAKALLATEQRIPGLGNGVSQDILFQARIQPKAKVLSLSQEQRNTLFGSVKTTLRDMAAQGGRDTEKTLYGRPGGYRTILSGKTAAYTCPACGGSITRQAYLGGNVYFCAHCQQL